MCRILGVVEEVIAATGGNDAVGSHVLTGCKLGVDRVQPGDDGLGELFQRSLGER